MHVTNIQAHHQRYNDQAKTEHYENIFEKMMMLLMSSFIEFLANRICSALFPAGTIVRDGNHCKLPTWCEQDCTCTESETRISGTTLYRNDIHNTKLPLHHSTAIYKQKYFTMFFRLIPVLLFFPTSKKLVGVQKTAISSGLIHKGVKQKHCCMKCSTDSVCNIFSTNSLFPGIDFSQKRVSKLF